MSCGWKVFITRIQTLSLPSASHRRPAPKTAKKPAAPCTVHKIGTTIYVSIENRTWPVRSRNTHRKQHEISAVSAKPATFVGSFLAASVAIYFVDIFSTAVWLVPFVGGFRSLSSALVAECIFRRLGGLRLLRRLYQGLVNSKMKSQNDGIRSLVERAAVELRRLMHDSQNDLA